MEVHISDRLKYLSSEKDCRRKQGPERAKKIFQRLNELTAAHALEDLRNMPGHWHELKHDRKGQFAVDLIQPYRMIFLPVGDPAKYVENGSFVWSKIESVQIIEVTDYHD